jgi:hypothetical protein
MLSVVTVFLKSANRHGQPPQAHLRLEIALSPHAVQSTIFRSRGPVPEAIAPYEPGPR